MLAMPCPTLHSTSAEPPSSPDSVSLLWGRSCAAHGHIEAMISHTEHKFDNEDSNSLIKVRDSRGSDETMGHSIVHKSLQTSLR